KARAEHQAKAHLYVSTEALKAEEVGRRLARYDAVCGRPVTRLHASATIGEQFLNLREMGASDAAAAEQALAKMSERQTRDFGPLRLVALDPVPGAGWFSLGQLRALAKDPRRWDAVLQERLSSAPQQYLGPAERAELLRLNARAREGRVEELLSELSQETVRRR